MEGDTKIRTDLLGLRKFIVPPPPSTPLRIRGEWQALKRERIGKEALAEWSVAIVAEKLKAVEPMAPSPLTAVGR